jgi:glycosyltransferase involved in cell wall biosynthesis
MFARVRELAPDHDVRLRIVGDGPLRGRLERAIARRGLTPYVELTGRLPREAVLDQLHRASVYVAPAPKESFGIAVLEARCAGLPIVASRRSGVTDMVRDRREGLLVEGDDQMAVALAELVVDDALRERIAGHNRRVAPAFDWGDVLDRTQVLYRVAVDRAARAAEAAEVAEVAEVPVGDLDEVVAGA